MENSAATRPILGQQHTRQLQLDAPILEGGPSPLPLHGSRLCSLWGLVEKYDVGELAMSLGQLVGLWKVLQKRDRDGQDAGEEVLKVLASVLASLENSAGLIDADPSLLAQISDVKSICTGQSPHRLPESIKEDRRPAVLATLTNAVADGMEVNLRSRLFMYIPSDQAIYYNNRDLFGPEVRAAFPDGVVNEIVQTGNCYAAGLWTASVFHSMRVTEHGLRMLARRVDVKLATNGKPVPIEYATWQHVIDGLGKKIKQERAKNKGTRQSRRLEWFASMADHCEYMKDLWRNEVSHARRLYTKPESLAALERVCDFCMKLVSGVPR